MEVRGFHADERNLGLDDSGAERAGRLQKRK
jgi:hypothetical protein